jgi:hypothetical protein
MNLHRSTQYSFTFFIATLLAVFGCESVTEKAKSVLNEQTELKRIKVIDQVTLSKNDETCSENCTTIDVSYPVLDNQHRLNQLIIQKINAEIADFSRNGSPDMQTESLMTEFISDYKNYKEAFPETTIPWSVSIESKVNYAVENLISIEILTVSYTGGAHANSETSYLNFDENGAEIDPISRITDITAFKTAAEAIFREKMNLTPTSDLSEAGYTFENNQYELPKNMGFSYDGVLLFYNNYEIASYADGAIALVVPYPFESIPSPL